MMTENKKNIQNGKVSIHDCPQGVVKSY